MSTYSTLATEVAATSYDDTDVVRVLRVSVDLAHGQVGLDVEVLSNVSLLEDRYDRTVLTPDAAREYAKALSSAADQAERIHR